MKRIRQLLLFVLFAFMSTSLSAQTDTETLVQNLQTANFNKLLLSWDNQVEVNLPNQSGQKQYSPAEANELLRSFFNRNNIIGFEKKEDRKVGSTIYLTGKLISGTVKYNLTILLQESKKGFAIISLRVS
jgi:hypothetical protein